MFNTYITLSIIFFLVSGIYFLFTSHPNDRNASFSEKIFTCIVLALIAPIIIMGAMVMFGIGSIAHGG